MSRLSRFADHPRYWDEERETLDPAVRESRIVDQLKVQLQNVYDRIPLYRNLYDENFFHPSEIEGLRHFTTRTPILTKEQLRKDQELAPPFGTYAGTTRSGLARVLTSSGTTGRPTVYGISNDDWSRGAEVARAGLWSLGVRPEDVVFLAFPFSLFMGSWGMLQGLDALGASVLPAGTQASADVQVELIAKIQPTVVVGTPSYLLFLGRALAAAGITAAPELALVSGEPGGSTSTGAQISALWGGALVQDFAAGMTSELYPYFSAVSCEHSDGIHITEDENYLEIVDVDDPNTPVPEGESGAVVVTTLWRTSQPMVRFWTGDEARLVRDVCACGRTYPRIAGGLRGRLDEKLNAQNVQFYVSELDSALRAGGLVGEFQVVVSDREVTAVRVEAPVAASTADFKEVVVTTGRTISDFLASSHSIDVEVREAGSLPEQTFKAKRVVKA